MRPILEHRLVDGLRLAQMLALVVGDARVEDVVMAAFDDVDGVDLHIAQVLHRGPRGLGAGAERRALVQPLRRSQMRLALALDSAKVLGFVGEAWVVDAPGGVAATRSVAIRDAVSKRSVAPLPSGDLCRIGCCIGKVDGGAPVLGSRGVRMLIGNLVRVRAYSSQRTASRRRLKAKHLSCHSTALASSGSERTCCTVAALECAECTLDSGSSR